MSEIILKQRIPSHSRPVRKKHANTPSKIEELQSRDLSPAKEAMVSSCVIILAPFPIEHVNEYREGKKN